MSETTALVRAQKTIRDLLEGPFKPKIMEVLPRHMRGDRFIRVALSVIMRPPAYPGAACLAECEPVSLMAALMDLGRMGLEPGGPLARAHLIPFRNRKKNCVEVQVIIDYKGLIELAMRSGLISSIHADVVCENDEFSYNLGQIEEHRINFREPRGKMYAAYAIARMKDGTTATVVMSAHDIEMTRRRSRAADDGPWVTDFDEMAKKTAVRRLAKYLPLSPEFADAMDKDRDGEGPATIDTSAADAIFAAHQPMIQEATMPAIEADAEVEQAVVDEAATVPSKSQIEELAAMRELLGDTGHENVTPKTIAEFREMRAALAKRIDAVKQRDSGEAPEVTPEQGKRRGVSFGGGSK